MAGRRKTGDVQTDEAPEIIVEPSPGSVRVEVGDNWFEIDPVTAVKFATELNIAANRARLLLLEAGRPAKQAA